MERGRGSKAGWVYTSLLTRPPPRLDSSDSCYCISRAAECDGGEDTLVTPRQGRHEIGLTIKFLLVSPFQRLCVKTDEKEPDEMLYLLFLYNTCLSCHNLVSPPLSCGTTNTL